VLKAVDHFERFARDTHVATARKLGTPYQRRALAKAVKETLG